MKLPEDVMAAIVNEDEAREMTYCVGCGMEKHRGLVVCWDCFKYNHNSLKYFPGSFEDWQRQVFQQEVA